MNKKLALNMMVGPADVALALRCLESFEANRLFDEIVVVVTSKDEQLAEQLRNAIDGPARCIIVADFFTPEDPKGNFARVRNIARVNTTSEYIMWLDSDDITDDSSRQSLYKMKQCVVTKDFDYFRVRYSLGDGRSLYRDRIFKNSPEVFWKYSCHEQLEYPYGAKYATINGVTVIHAPMKLAALSINRNMEILEHEYAKDPSNIFYKFHLTKELLASCRNNAWPVEAHFPGAYSNAMELISQHVISGDAAAKLCIDIVSLSLPEDWARSETLLYIAMAHDNSFAEAEILLGQLYLSKRQYDLAIKLFMSSIGRTRESSQEQIEQMYTTEPMKGLTEAYYRKGELELALYWSSRYLKMVPNDKDFSEFRAELCQSLINTYSRMK